MKHIVIVGGGYFGVDAYRAVLREARREVRRGEVRVTLVSASDHHAFHGWTGEVLGGVVRAEHVRTPLPGLVPHATFLHARAEHVELTSRSLTVRLPDHTQRTLTYDRLLLGMGSRDPIERVPGVREHAWRLKQSGDLRAFHTRLHAELQTDGDPLRIVVIGGGFAGVEMTAAIAELARDVRKREVRVHLVTSGDRILDELRPRFTRLAEYAERELRALGVTLHLGVRAERVGAREVHLQGGTVVESDLTLLTAGVAYDTLPGTEALPRDGRGRLVTDAYLRVRGHEDILAGGDAALVEHVGGGVCPTNALWAMKHGMWAGGNAARSLLGRPPRRFTYRGLGQAASVGVGRGVTELRGLQFTGLAGWLLRLGFFAWYMPSRRQGARVLTDWARTFTRGRTLEGQGAARAGRVGRARHGTSPRPSEEFR
ncbi:NAD(P)/FAD-dependent oxidoreductase [Deinococcus pimensis]|uniref:NAD(P)/FAD-dependent oxidoreductase n=1 Tax=Deinococcus pimensis TaxID=309888 RepID=UPI00048469DD|nr:FAD-dependent oxidoreductase [Deinococcus pimensis]